VVDVLSTGYHWLNDNVFRVIHDVVLQAYLWAKVSCERLMAAVMPLFHAFRLALQSVFILMDQSMATLLRVAARAPCVAGTVADVIRAPLEDVAAKSGAAVSRVVLRGGAELHMLRDGYINGDGGTDEPLYVPATRIAMPNGPNRQRETLADWVKYDSWIAEEPANRPFARSGMG
jgi:hypothetical protein